MYNIIKAAEAGQTGNPTDYCDFSIAPPASHEQRHPDNKRLALSTNTG
jgi:hypothetical protein